MLPNRTIVEDHCDAGMVGKLLNICNGVTGVTRCFHYVNIGLYLRMMAGWGTKGGRGEGGGISATCIYCKPICM